MAFSVQATYNHPLTNQEIPNPMDNPRAILFADIAGSTGLYEQSGDTVALEAVVNCLNCLKAETLAQGGSVVKTIGDELMAVFDTAAQALLAANAMQSTFEKTLGGKAGIRLRIGCHFGSVIEAEGDCFGDTVNLAARLTALATPDQILTSRETYDALPAYLQATCRKLYSTAVKGRKGKVTIIEALWKQDQGQTLLSDNSASDEASSKDAVISYRGNAWRVDEAHPEITIGRDGKCDMVVTAATASRHHASIVLRHGKISILDQSSNGTFVRLQNGQNLLLRREELTLAGKVLVGLGTTPDACGEELLVIEVER
ncbi:MAG: adenylate/guanylate cyclase domain-containing protein [Sulfuritalea sp.]|nr:adenylate/guanylate cyclase domain-containing protein [Sulfuritalea sp.]